MVKKTTDQPTLNEENWDSFDDDWEEVGNDNGEIVQFKSGDVMFGIFLGGHMIPLPEDKQTNGQTEAELYIFEYPDRKGERWSVWATYQLREAMENVTEPEGKLFRIECQGTRKASQGEVKIFSVKVRTNR